MRPLRQNYSVSIEASESEILNILLESSHFSEQVKPQSSKRISIASLEPIYIKKTGDNHVSVSMSSDGSGLFDTAAHIEIMAFDENFSMLLAYFRLGVTAPWLLPFFGILLAVIGVLVTGLLTLWGAGILAMSIGVWVYWRIKVKEIRQILHRVSSALRINESWRKVDGRAITPISI